PRRGGRARAARPCGRAGGRAPGAARRGRRGPRRARPAGRSRAGRRGWRCGPRRPGRPRRVARPGRAGQRVRRAGVRGEGSRSPHRPRGWGSAGAADTVTALGGPCPGTKVHPPDPERGGPATPRRMPTGGGRGRSAPVAVDRRGGSLDVLAQLLALLGEPLLLALALDGLPPGHRVGVLGGHLLVDLLRPLAVAVLGRAVVGHGASRVARARSAYPPPGRPEP